MIGVMDEYARCLKSGAITASVTVHRKFLQ